MYFDVIKNHNSVIDLRSDTGTLPTEEMWSAMNHALTGDGGRMELNGRGEDPTVDALERQAAQILGKEDAIYVATGSLANHIALLNSTNRGDKVLVEKNAHVLINEKYDFMDKGSGLVPVRYHLNSDYLIDPDEIEYLLGDDDIRVMCLENTHNYSSGTCLTPDNIRQVCRLAHEKGVHVHMDGARLFNSAVAQNVDVRELTKDVDSVMFCISKGLSAPVGSLLAGSQEFIDSARVTRKLLGAVMRNAGVIAAAGLVALERNIGRLAEDHENAGILGELIGNHPKVIYDPRARQTNMIYLDVSPTGKNAQQVTDDLIERGLLVAKMTDSEIRMVTNRNVDRKSVERAADILNQYFDLFI